MFVIVEGFVGVWVQFGFVFRQEMVDIEDFWVVLYCWVVVQGQQYGYYVLVFVDGVVIVNVCVFVRCYVKVWGSWLQVQCFF